MNELEPRINLYNRYKASVCILEDLSKSLKSTDAEERQFAQDEMKIEFDKVNGLQQEALGALVTEEEFNDCTSTTLEVRPGVGGGEGSLFAEDVFNMFQSYASVQGWNCRVIALQRDTSIGKGCKYGVLQIDGDKSYHRLKCESGVHKVIRVPETESKGRIHSSTVTVAVLPNVKDEFVLDERELRIDFMRAQGAGGQHVNKTDSACRVTHLPTGMQVVNQDERSQDKNKQRAMKEMRDRLFQMHVSARQQKMATRRKAQIGASDRSDKIRTYNYPQDRITDHRTNLTLFGIEKMMQGGLIDEFIEAMLEKIYNAKLEDVLEELDVTD